ncbi:MAG: hypothetical protein JNK04_16110 [Myxococcales bacterium]|nr:hypothetical protein [Myxococcales bacterium]
MSAHGSKKRNGRAQLMLLRGGLDDFSGASRSASAAALADEADWQSFCARIGWQGNDDEVGDDYADCLAAKIFGSAELRDNVIELAVEREAKAVKETTAKEAPVSESALRRATARGALLAVAGMAAAAVVCFFGASVLSAAGGTARAVPARDASEPVIAPPPVESSAPDASALPVESATPKTAPKPPGTLVAQRSTRQRARGRAVAQQVAAAAQDHHAGGVQTALAAPVPLADMIDLPPGRLHDFERAVVPDASSLTPRVVRAEAQGGAPHGSTEPAIAWSTPSERAGNRQAVGSAGEPLRNWGLTPASERWYGVGLAPTYEPSSLPSGMAVMAQVDVGKALKL